MKTKPIVLLAALFLFLLGVGIGCDEKNDDLSQTEEAVIRYLPPEDNCGAFMVVVGDPDNIKSLWYKPENLPVEFEVDGLKVEITYTVTKKKHNCGFGGDKPVIIIKDIENIQNVRTPQTRITGGYDLNIQQAPWQVLLKVGNDFICGGSIISENCILTARHCVEDLQPQNI